MHPTVPSPLGSHTFVLYVCVSISALQIRSSIPFFQISHICVNIWYLFFRLLWCFQRKEWGQVTGVKLGGNHRLLALGRMHKSPVGWVDAAQGGWLPQGGPPTRARGPQRLKTLGDICHCQLTHAREQPRKTPSPGGTPEQVIGDMPSAF